jgi:hypothetical protein
VAAAGFNSALSHFVCVCVVVYKSTITARAVRINVRAGEQALVQKSRELLYQFNGLAPSKSFARVPGASFTRERREDIFQFIYKLTFCYFSYSTGVVLLWGGGREEINDFLESAPPSGLIGLMFVLN